MFHNNLAANKKRFFAILQQELSPRLRDVGFKGSGQNFYRCKNDIINVFNIQGNKYGGSCAVNLGVHPKFLPADFENEVRDIRKFRAYQCAFRERLKPHGETDYWWEYNKVFVSPRKRARHLIDTYFKYGERQFEGLNSIEKITDLFTIDHLRQNVRSSVVGNMVCLDTAMTLARIYVHLGNKSKAEEFAVFGLKNLGRATARRSKYEDIINTTYQ